MTSMCDHRAYGGVGVSASERPFGEVAAEDGHHSDGACVGHYQHLPGNGACSQGGGGDGATTGAVAMRDGHGNVFRGAASDWHQLRSVYHKASISVCA